MLDIILDFWNNLISLVTKLYRSFDLPWDQLCWGVVPSLSWRLAWWGSHPFQILGLWRGIPALSNLWCSRWKAVRPLLSRLTCELSSLLPLHLALACCSPSRLACRCLLNFAFDFWSSRLINDHYLRCPLATSAILRHGRLPARCKGCHLQLKLEVYWRDQSLAQSIFDYYFDSLDQLLVAIFHLDWYNSQVGYWLR